MGEKSTKTLTATLLALVVSTPFALADGCDSHGEDMAMSCVTGETWDTETKKWVNTNA
jgi:hypothetical protein